jgi:hypothetical protein
MRSDALGFFWFDEPVKKEAKAPPVKRTPPDPTWESPDYLPGLEKALAFNPIPLTEYDLLCAPAHEELIFDIEIYPNYFLASFESMLTGKVMEFELSPWKRCDMALLRRVLESYCTVGFNSLKFDMCIAAMAVNGCTTEQMCAAANALVNEGARSGDILRSWKIKKIQANHIDLIEVAPLRANLKIYGGRLHSKRMQDLPFKPGTVLSYHQAVIVRYYNIMADLKATKLIRESLQPQVMLRYEMSNEYKIDLRSKSDAQIAESVFADEIGRLNGTRPQQPKIDPGTMYRYRVPSNMMFQTDLMKWVLGTVANADFIVADHGAVTLPPVIGDMDIKIGKMTYQMGIGGLHSTEKKQIHYSDKLFSLKDRDVTSYYPKIILNQGLFPSHLGPNFLRVYRVIVERRIAAKVNAAKCKLAGDLTGEAQWKNIAESLKIVINGSFGKLGSMFSILYAPDLLFQVTISGQLYLLMMIEQMELHGIEVVSANTDGVVMRVPKTHEHVYEAIIKWWENQTNFETEETEYLALFSRDVNSYLALKTPDKNGVIKTKNKGAFANPWSDETKIEERFHKNPANQICIDAITALLTKGVPIDHTIRSSADVTKFVTVRTVKGKGDGSGGAVMVTAKEGQPDVFEFLGKSIRWYYSANRREQELIYSINGNRVPRSEGAKPCLDLPETFPNDIDYDWYIEETTSILRDVGYY